MNNTMRICGKHEIPCPARCNGWHLPCEDEIDFSPDDLAPAKGILKTMVAGLSVWALLGVVAWAVVRSM